MDPFPLFHLAELDFECSPTTLANLPAYQLALAPWSTSWEDGLEATLKRTWRRRRERVRAQINAKAPMGVQVPEPERNGELFPKFELIALDFDLSGGEAALQGLTSAQLAAVRFHPAATPDLVLAAEDIFFDRRERDFAAGLSLQSVALPAAAPPTTAPDVPPSAPLPPAPTPADAAAPVAARPAVVPAPPAPSLPIPPVVPQQVASTLAPVPSTSAAPIPAPGSPLPFGLPAASTSIETAAPAPPVTLQPTTETLAKPKSRLPSSVLRSAQAQPEAAVELQPKKEDEANARERDGQKERPVEREMTPGTKEREKERAEYKRSKSVNGTAEERGRRGSLRERSRSRSRDRARPTSRDRAGEGARKGEGEGARQGEEQAHAVVSLAFASPHIPPRKVSLTISRPAVTPRTLALEVARPQASLKGGRGITDVSAQEAAEPGEERPFPPLVDSQTHRQRRLA